MKKPNIEFSLAILTRRDEDCQVWVGYIPALRLYSQAKDETALEKSLCVTATSFLELCWERQILEQVMHERGMKKSSRESTDQAKSTGAQYIIIGNAESDAYGEVPIALLAGKQQAMIECRR